MRQDKDGNYKLSSSDVEFVNLFSAAYQSSGYDGLEDLIRSFPTSEIQLVEDDVWYAVIGGIVDVILLDNPEVDPVTGFCEDTAFAFANIDDMLLRYGVKL